MFVFGGGIFREEGRGKIEEGRETGEEGGIDGGGQEVKEEMGRVGCGWGGGRWTVGSGQWVSQGNAC